MTDGSTKGFMAMKGAGYYSRATIGAKHVMDNAAGLVLDAVERMAPADDGSVFRVTDMGCADGGTSLDMWRRVLRQVREAAPGRPIEIVYTDLPRNDFSQVFRHALGLTEAESYVASVPEVYVMASATSFHEAILPPGTLDLGFRPLPRITSPPCPARLRIMSIWWARRRKSGRPMRRRERRIGSGCCWPGRAR